MVSLTVPPTIQPFAFTKSTMSAGDFVNLQCIVEGDLPLKIHWTHPHMAEVMVTKVAERVSMLMISSVQASHAGDYVCTAKNAAGKVSYTAVLAVNGSIDYHSLSFVAFAFFFYCSFPCLTFSIIRPVLPIIHVHFFPLLSFILDYFGF